MKQWFRNKTSGRSDPREKGNKGGKSNVHPEEGWCTGKAGAGWSAAVSPTRKAKRGER